MTSSAGPGKTPAVRSLLILVVATAACGDNLYPPGQPLDDGGELTIVAHQDDDLLFMQPDLADLVERHAQLTTVYVTAGNGNGGLEVSDKRNDGVREAYAEGAGVLSDWTCGTIVLADHPVEHCRLAGAPISLVFLGYPDGGKEGEKTDSLLRLWDGSITSAETVARQKTRFDQAGLIATVAEVIRQVGPRTIRTLEIAGTHGRDHVDHMIVGALTLAAAAESGSGATLLAYRGYDTIVEPETAIDGLYERSLNMLAHYHACAIDCASCGSACMKVDPTHEQWLRRRYAIGSRSRVSGQLRTEGGCVTTTAGSDVITLDPTCANPAEVQLDAGGLRVGNRCAQVLDDGELRLGTGCPPVARNLFLLDDEGHLWNGAPATPSEVTVGQHVRCLASRCDRLVVDACGVDNAPRWTLAHHGTALPRPTWLPSNGRALGVFNSYLYTVVGGELLEAAITETGLAAPTTLGALPVEPESLVVASLEPGTFRACGRDADGILCGSIYASYSQAPYTVERWTSAFARTGPATPADRSLSAFGTEICGLTDDGLICAPRGPTFVPAVRTRWTRPDTTLWIGDLDDDRGMDWCAATSAGVSCGRDGDRMLTTDGAPWSYSFAGTREPAPRSTAIGALHDIDGDRRQDLCTVEGRTIVCARSQGHGFGPRTVVATLPPGGEATALWFHFDRACVDDGSTLACVVVPPPPFPI